MLYVQKFVLSGFYRHDEKSLRLWIETLTACNPEIEGDLLNSEK